jgi:hypothetical protein
MQNHGKKELYSSTFCHIDQEIIIIIIIIIINIIIIIIFRYATCASLASIILGIVFAGS